MDRTFLVVLGMIVVYASFFIFFMLSKHYSFMTYMYDLGVYDTVFWNILAFGDQGFPFAGNQQSQLVYLLLPIYALGSNAVTLLIIQSVIVPLGAIPLYKLAKMELGESKLALFIVLAYLLYPPLHGASSFDFHLQSFLPTFFLAAAYYYRSSKWKRYILFLILVLITTRYASYLAATFGIYLLLPHLKSIVTTRKADLSSILTNPSIKFAIITIIASSFLILIHNMVQIEGFWITPTNPIGISFEDKFMYFFNLYGPLGFISMLNPGHILAASPWIGATLVTDNIEYLAIYNHHSTFIIAFLFIGLVQGLKKMSLQGRKVSIVLILIATVIFFSTVDPVASNPYQPITPGWPNVTEMDLALVNITETIPENASVFTQNNIAPHLSNRQEIWITFDKIDIYPDYIIVDIGHYSYYDPSFGQSPASVLPQLLDSGKYELKIQCGETISLYQKGYRGDIINPQMCIEK